jgi:hypothetical protein
MKGLALALKGGPLPGWFGPALVISGLIVLLTKIKEAKRPEPEQTP